MFSQWAQIPNNRRSSPKIERTFCFLDGEVFHDVVGDHGGFQIAVTKQLLNCANSDICLQEMAGKTVAEGMSRGPLTEVILPTAT